MRVFDLRFGSFLSGNGTPEGRPGKTVQKQGIIGVNHVEAIEHNFGHSAHRSLSGSRGQLGSVVAQKAPVPKTQNNLALGEGEVKQLLLLMDTDNDGKVSKKEFMDFMEAEFERLDKNRSGDLDVKELAQSRLRVSHFAGVGK
jgi:EF-hand domain pair